jgi:hypothetical protein
MGIGAVERLKILKGNIRGGDYLVYEQAVDWENTACPIIRVLASTREKVSPTLSMGHFLGHVQDQLAIFLVGLAQ